MDFDLNKNDSISILPNDNKIQNSHAFFGDLKDFCSANDFYNNFLSDSKTNDRTTNTDDATNTAEPRQEAEDILQNGILVQTNKGVVCMSLKEVLSSNVELSADDFKQAATQLLSSQEPNAQSSSSSGQTAESIENQKQLNSISKVTPISYDLNDDSLLSQYMQNDGNHDLVANTFLNLPPIIFDDAQSTSAIDTSEENETDENCFTIRDEENFSKAPILFNPAPAVRTANNRDDNEIINDYAVQSTSAVDTSEENDKNIIINKVKRRGGWPKGRKRKPEFLDLPPKAPKTSYNIFLNERRKLYKDTRTFHEITKIVGNEWSSLTYEEKQPYWDRAEEDKKRYREELRVYRQSDAYKLYLARKRKKRALDNLLSESDMDGTDDIEDEDNDQLYCDSCDQWFYNLHNKREHLLSRQHKIIVAGNVKGGKVATSDNEKGHISSVSFSTSLDESSMDGLAVETNFSMYIKRAKAAPDSVHDSMMKLIEFVTKREKEIRVLNERLQESKSSNNTYLLQLNSLNEKSNRLKTNLYKLKLKETSLKKELVNLCSVPSLFIRNSVDIVKNV